MDAVTPKAKHDTLDTHSHVVRPAQMEWKKTRFPGCEVKGLLFDKESGVVTALMKFAPGAVLPDHEHVKIEQTYVLEGKLVDTFITEVSQDTWIYFPWDTGLAFQPPIREGGL